MKKLVSFLFVSLLPALLLAHDHVLPHTHHGEVHGNGWVWPFVGMIVLLAIMVAGNYRLLRKRLEKK